MSEEQKQRKEIFSTEIQALLAGILSTTKYFDAKFDYLKVQIDGLRRNQQLMREDIKEFKKDMEYRFTLVDKHFEQVDKKFEQVIASIDRIADKLANRHI